MPKKIDPKVEGQVIGLSKAGSSQRSIVDTLRRDNIVISQRTVSRIINNVGNRRVLKAKGQPSPIKRQPCKVVTPRIVKRIDLLTQKENPPSQREIAHLVKVSQASVNAVIKKLGKRLARKTRVHKLTPAHMKNRMTRSRKLYEGYLAGQRSEFVVTLDEAMFGMHNVNGKRKVCYVRRGQRVNCILLSRCLSASCIGILKLKL